jgi:hypothetical protein
MKRPFSESVVSFMELVIPEYDITIHPGDIIKIGRFDRISWLVGYGWYSWGGNRPVCGWSLRSKRTDDVKPLLDIDLVDVYFVSYADVNSQGGGDNG